MSNQGDPDAPPSFPLLNGPQVASGTLTKSGPNRPQASGFSAGADAKRTAGLMPPPTVSGPTARSRLAASSLMPPPSTTVAAPLRLAPASTSSSGAGGLLAPSAPKAKRNKVALAPGFGPLDWARMKNSGKPELRAGVTQLLPITRDELKKHNTPEDAWSAFYGKVYNLTPYLRYHPGGVDELMRVAGRDGSRLFMLTHSWVNIEAMIDTTMVGYLVQN